MFLFLLLWLYLREVHDRQNISLCGEIPSPAQETNLGRKGLIYSFLIYLLAGHKPGATSGRGTLDEKDKSSWNSYNSYIPVWRQTANTNRTVREKEAAERHSKQRWAKPAVSLAKLKTQRRDYSNRQTIQECDSIKKTFFLAKLVWDLSSQEQGLKLHNLHCPKS